MQPINVLLIAEDEDFSEILTNRLCSWGFAATATSNRDEAMEAILLSRPDVVLLSLRVGHGHDLDTLSLIKNINPAIEVILLTCRGTAITGMKGVEQGAFDCIHQPIDLGLLIEKIRLAHARRSLPGDSFAVPLLLPWLAGGEWNDLSALVYSCIQILLEGLLPI